MNFFAGILMGLKEIWAHKVRSLLTMTGIILGVASLVSMFGIVQGMLAGWKRWIVESGGLEKVTVEQEAPPQEQQHLAGISPGRTLRDAEAIEAGCPLARYVAPEVNLGGARIQRMDEVYRTPSGKVDFQHTRKIALAALGLES